MVHRKLYKWLIGNNVKFDEWYKWLIGNNVKLFEWLVVNFNYVSKYVNVKMFDFYCGYH
jgi:hypothetical protein